MNGRKLKKNVLCRQLNYWENEKNLEKNEIFDKTTISMKCEKNDENSNILEKNVFLSNNYVFQKMWKMFKKKLKKLRQNNFW